ncbi:hypothetical protein DL768_011652 [Monosporascus sp. mg162]|nr:hypothetical protein DL768_011652 [Monosporascus sp. mg162]
MVMHQRVPLGTDMQSNARAPKLSAERLRRAKELMANYFPQPAPHAEDPVSKAYDINDLRTTSELLAEGLPLPPRIVSEITHHKNSTETNIQPNARASLEPSAQTSPPEKELIYERLQSGLKARTSPALRTRSSSLTKKILPAARLLRSNSGKVLFSELPRLHTAVASDNYELDCIKPFLKSALADDPDDVLI